MEVRGIYEWAVQSINCTIGCQNACAYCLGEGTLILMADGTSKRIENVKIGDEVIGFTEYGRTKYKKAVVTNGWTTDQVGYEIKLQNGTSIICSAEHRWLSNRGWKYTDGREQGQLRRPFLTSNNQIKFLSKLVDEGYFKPTPKYQSGYLAGMIRGDGTLGHYQYERRGAKDNRFQFRLALKDQCLIDRTKEYLTRSGVQTTEFIFDPQGSRLSAIRTSKKSDFVKICKLIEYNFEDPEFRRGFVAGIFDAEGSGGTENPVLRIYNTDDRIIDFLQGSLSEFGFSATEDRTNKNGCRVIRVPGGLPETVRFFQTFTPKATRKFRYEGVAHHYGGIKVESITNLGERRKMYDITTTTSTFIANGFLSHNCFGRRLALMRKDINNLSEWSTTLRTKRNERKEKTLYRGTVMFPSAHDIFPENLDICLEVIGNLLRLGNHVLITSKPRAECINAICKEFESYWQEMLFRFTIGCLDEDIIGIWEPGAPSAEERLAVLRTTYGLGFQTSVSMEPMLDALNIEEDVETMLPYITDGIWIGKMNKIRERVSGVPEEEVRRIEEEQSDERVIRIYNALSGNEKIRWKDSFKKIVGLPSPTTSGIDR